MALKIVFSGSEMPVFLKKVLALNSESEAIYIKIEQSISDAEYTKLLVSTSNINMDEKLNKMNLHFIEYKFTHDLEGENFIKQGYEFLKTLPEYFDAIDC